MKKARRNDVNVNSARAMQGKNVNLCMKDGSVILNVRVVETENREVRCKMKGQRKLLKVLLKEVEWFEELNPHFVK